MNRTEIIWMVKINECSKHLGGAKDNQESSEVLWQRDILIRTIF